MADEKKQEEKPIENERPDLINDALIAAETLKRENERMEQNIKQLQELKAWEMLGGKSRGKEPEEKPQEIDHKTYAELLLKGIIPQKT